MHISWRKLLPLSTSARSYHSICGKRNFACSSRHNIHIYAVFSLCYLCIICRKRNHETSLIENCYIFNFYFVYSQRISNNSSFANLPRNCYQFFYHCRVNMVYFVSIIFPRFSFSASFGLIGTSTSLNFITHPISKCVREHIVKLRFDILKIS